MNYNTTREGIATNAIGAAARARRKQVLPTTTTAKSLNIERRKSNKRIFFSNGIHTIVSHSIVGLVCLYIGLALGIGKRITLEGGIATSRKMTTEEVHGMMIEHESIQEIPARTPPFSERSNKFLVDFATVPRDEFNELIDNGVPLDDTRKGAEDVVVFYTSNASMPTDMDTLDKTNIDPSKALENCHEVKIILQEPSRKGFSQCLAILPQWESYTVHKWMRVPPPSVPKTESTVNLAYPLKKVARTQTPDGSNRYHSGLPSEQRTAESNMLLVEYLKNRDRVLPELTDFLKNEVVEKASNPDQTTLVVMTCNKGQSDMFWNFVCNARAKGLDLSHVVLFATDEYTYRLGKELGIHSWYDIGVFGSIPEMAAKKYGDRVFAKMMMAKVYCMDLALRSGYNVLFQDADVVWHRDPLPFLLSKEFQEWDMVFQDDGNRVWRYTPYSPNSGFYFVRNNPTTRYLFETFLRLGDLIHVTTSHQHVLNDLLIQFSSWKGLRVKVLKKGDTNVFPGGVEFHNKADYMRGLLNGTRTDPYIFHMSWTNNAETKKKFFQQLGEWYTQGDTDGCTGMGCCLVSPNITCHYRDKPSKVPCPNSPCIDGGDTCKKSFW